MNAVRLSETIRNDMPLLIDALGLKTGVEIGVAEGFYSHILLKQSSLDLLWSVDPYTSGRFSKQVNDAIPNLAEFGDRSELKIMTSMEAVELARKKDVTFDFIYVDGGHRPKNVSEDIDQWFERLSRPGILAGHDYISGREKWCIDVIPIVNEFADKVNMPLYLTGEQWATWFFVFGE